jgi:hypothetical protein
MWEDDFGSSGDWGGGYDWAGGASDYGYDSYADPMSWFDTGESSYFSDPIADMQFEWDGGQQGFNDDMFGQGGLGDFGMPSLPGYSGANFVGFDGGMQEPMMEAISVPDWGAAPTGINENAKVLGNGNKVAGNLATGAITDFLKSLFSGQKGTKNAVTAGSGLLSMLTKQKANKEQQELQQQMMTKMDPFGSQRPQYQAQLAQTYSDPNAVLNMPDIKGQLAQMRASLDAKDAAAGRRSQYGSREVQLAQEAAKLMQGYRNQLGGFAGANINPNVGQANALLNDTYSANNNPLNSIASAAGTIVGNNTNSSLLEQILAGR